MAESEEHLHNDDGNCDGEEDRFTESKIDHELPDNRPDSSYTVQQKLTLVILCTGYFFLMLSMSIIAPFFPTVAKQKSVSDTHIGFVFATFSLVCFLVSSVWGKLIPVLGAKFTLLTGLWLAGGSNIIFGFLDQIQSDTLFLIFCYITRAVEAVGNSAYFTAAMAIVSKVFPEDVGQIMGFTEIFVGLGMTLGPPLGGFLYEFGGYMLPFLALGGATIFIVVITMFVLPSTGSTDEDETGSFRELLSIPTIWPILLVVLITGASLSFLDATLAIFLQTLDLSPKDIGLVFICFSVFYALTSPLWGFIADKTNAIRLMITVALFVSSMGLILLGPAPFLNLPSKLWAVCVFLGVYSVGVGAGFVLTYIDVLSSALGNDMPDDFGTHGVVSGLYSTVFYLGCFIGPSFGGALVEQIGFPWAAACYGFVTLLVFAVVLVSTLCENGCGKWRRKYQPVTDDTTPLVPLASSLE